MGRKKLERGLLVNLFPGRSYPDLTQAELRTYQNEWKKRNSVSVKAKRDAGRDERNRLRREKFQNNPELRIARRAKEFAWRRANPGALAKSYRKYRLKKEYGLTIPQFEVMVMAQGGKCALCGAADGGRSKWKTLSVDHCHATGKVRALLCHQCNMVLGHCRDNPALLRKAADYVEHHARTI